MALFRRPLLALKYLNTGLGICSIIVLTLLGVGSFRALRACFEYNTLDTLEPLLFVRTKYTVCRFYNGIYLPTTLLEYENFNYLFSPIESAGYVWDNDRLFYLESQRSTKNKPWYVQPILLVTISSTELENLEPTSIDYTVKEIPDIIIADFQTPAPSLAADTQRVYYKGKVVPQLNPAGLQQTENWLLDDDTCMVREYAGPIREVENCDPTKLRSYINPESRETLFTDDQTIWNDKGEVIQ